MAWINFLEKNALLFKGKTAIVDQKTGRRLSYEGLNYEVDRWASYLQCQDVGPHDRVAFLATNCLEHVLIFLACAKIKAVMVPLNFRHTSHEVVQVLRRTRPRLFINDFPNCVCGDYPTVMLPEVELSRPSFVPYYAEANDPVLMLFTSGSTGHPKGVLMHTKMLQSNQEETCKAWEIQKEDASMVETPFFHTGGLNVILLPLLLSGGKVVLAEKFSEENVFETISKEKLSIYFAVPTMFQRLSEHKGFSQADFSSLRYLISGGAACPVELVKAYQKKGLSFKQGFGLTEVGPNCFLLEETMAIKKVGSIGRPMPHTEVKVVSNEGELVRVGQTGELLLAGPHVCGGYFEDEDLYKKSLDGEYFKTGDLVRFDEDGYFYVVGRKKDMYISGGENVYPGEVERELCRHPGIDQAVVVSVPDEKWGEVGFAFIQAQSALGGQDVRRFLKGMLSRYKHPRYIQGLNEFPLLANGKIDRSKLKEWARREGQDGSID